MFYVIEQGQAYYVGYAIKGNLRLVNWMVE